MLACNLASEFDDHVPDDKDTSKKIALKKGAKYKKIGKRLTLIII